MAGSTRILVADDHVIFREGLKRLLESESGFEVIGLAGDASGAVRLAREHRPEVMLLDLAMPGGGGLEVLRQLSDAHADVRTVLLTADIESEEMVRAVQLGARGVLLKQAATELLFRCIRAVVQGEYWVGREQFARMAQTLHEQRQAPPPVKTLLSGREKQIVAAIVDGASNKDIAQQLSLSPQTVKNHLTNIFNKLGVSNRLELALYAGHHRLLDDGPSAE